MSCRKNIFFLSLHEWEWVYIGMEGVTFSFCTIIVTYVHLYKVMNENVTNSMAFFIQFSFISLNKKKIYIGQVAVEFFFWSEMLLNCIWVEFYVKVFFCFVKFVIKGTPHTGVFSYDFILRRKSFVFCIWRATTSRQLYLMFYIPEI